MQYQLDQLTERVGALEVQQAVAQNSLETLAEGFHEMSGAIQGLTDSINQGKGILWTFMFLLGTVDVVALLVFFSSRV